MSVKNVTINFTPALDEFRPGHLIIAEFRENEVGVWEGPTGARSVGELIGFQNALPLVLSRTGSSA